MISAIISYISPLFIGRYCLARCYIGTFYIDKKYIYATLIRADGLTRTIERCEQHPFAQDIVVDSERDHIVQLLKKIIASWPRLYEVHGVLASDVVLFKELSLPFIDPEKIALITPYEIESSLPFPLSQVSISAIPLALDAENKRSDVLACVAPLDQIELLVHAFADAGVPLNRLSVGLIELMALYAQMPEYHQRDKMVMLIHAMEHMTEYLLYNKKGQVAHVRVSKIGYASDRFERDILLSIQALQPVDAMIEQIQVITADSNAAAWMERIAVKLAIPVTAIMVSALLHTETIKAAQASLLQPDYAWLLTPGLDYPPYSWWNILSLELMPNQAMRFGKVLVTATVMMIAAIGLLLGYAFWSNRRASAAINRSQQEARIELSKAISLKGAWQKQPLARLNDQAFKAVGQEQEVWLPIASPDRLTVLEYMYILTEAIYEIPSLEMSGITIDVSNKRIRLQGKVADFDALKQLQESLERMHIVEASTVPRMQDTLFDIVFTVKHERDQ